MSKLKLTIDGYTVCANTGDTILQAALNASIYIPHLCYHPALPHVSECKLCVVMIEGQETPATACSTPATDGMTITTKTSELADIRKVSMELMLASHPSECTDCPKYLKCEFQALIQYMGISDTRLRKLPGNSAISHENPLLVRDQTRCILCGRCVRACRDLRGIGVLDIRRDGERVYIAPQDNAMLKDTDCKFCGACAAVCPTGAIRDHEHLMKLFDNPEDCLVPCRAACPAGIDVPAYLEYIRQGNYAQALNVIREKAPFALSLGHVCMRFCEAKCRRGEVNEPVSIRELKRAAATFGGDSWKSKVQSLPPSGKRVAVVGAGPAGLTAAYYLARKGHAVEVFEALPMAGGMLSVGIPAYRLPRDVIRKEVDSILDAGVKLHTNHRIDNVTELLSQDFDAVVAAIGAHKGRRLPVEGATLPGVMTATDFLKSVALGGVTKLQGDVVVLGGGNVAFDCARSAKRLGATTSTIACLEGRKAMTASKDEIEEGLEEGIQLCNDRTFNAIRQGDRLSISCSMVKSFGLEDGRLTVSTVDGSEHELEADLIVFASGQAPDVAEGFGLETTVRGLLQSRGEDARVFAVGDAVTGTASVIEAIAAARETAIAVDCLLGGDGNICEQLSEPPSRSRTLDKRAGFAQQARHDASPTEIFAQAEGCVTAAMDDQTARKESERCLQCDLRLELPRVRFWSEYDYK